MDLETECVTCSCPQWQVKIYDAAIVYSYEDCDLAKDTMNMMNSIDLGNGLKPKVCLYDNPQFSPSSIKRVCDVVDKCTFLFLLLTKNFKKNQHLDLFSDEAIGITRLDTCGNCGNPPTLTQKKYYAVRPLHTQQKEKRDYPTPLGLTTIAGFDLYQESIKYDLKNFFNCFKKEIGNLNGYVESPFSLRSASSRSALALPRQDIYLNSNRLPEVSSYAHTSEAAITIKLDDDPKATIFTDAENNEIKDESVLDGQKMECEKYNTITESGYASNSNCCFSSISISERRDSVNSISNMATGNNSSTNHRHSEPMLRTDSVSQPNHLLFSEIVENRRLEGRGCGYVSSRSLLDSAAFPFIEKKKSSREQRAKKVVSDENFPLFQNDSGVPSNSDLNRKKVSKKHVEDDSDSEWSNEDPVFPTFKNVEPSTKQGSSKKSLVPSDSTEKTMHQPNSTQRGISNLDLVISIEASNQESESSLQQRISNDIPNDLAATGNQKDQRPLNPITAVNSDSKEENPQETAENYSTDQLLPEVGEDTHADTKEALDCKGPLDNIPPLSIQCLQENSIVVDARVALVVNQDQVGFSTTADDSPLPSNSRISNYGTYPFSYHSLQSDHFRHRQMSFMDVAHLTGLYEPVLKEYNSTNKTTN